MLRKRNKKGGETLKAKQKCTIDVALLDYAIKKASLSKKELCERVGISTAAYYRKLNGVSEFTRSEMMKIGEILNLDSLTPIFFADFVA